MRILHKQFEYNLKVIHIISKFSELFEKNRCLFPSSVHSEKKNTENKYDEYLVIIVGIFRIEWDLDMK